MTDVSRSFKQVMEDLGRLLPANSIKKVINNYAASVDEEMPTGGHFTFDREGVEHTGIVNPRLDGGDRTITIVGGQQLALSPPFKFAENGYNMGGDRDACSRGDLSYEMGSASCWRATTEAVHSAAIELEKAPPQPPELGCRW